MYTACRAIQNNECQMALVGAVKCDLVPLKKEAGLDIGVKDIKEIQAPDLHTRTFDERCAGTGGAEGTFAFVLKGLDDAMADGDDIKAVILGGAINQDGTSNGLTSPNANAQEELIVRAIKDSNVSAESISYIEAHGTATPLGDPIEVKGIQQAFKHFTNKKQFCAIGSLKTNIGHLDHASGLGGIAKIILAMQHKMIPASINFMQPNRKINFVESPVYVNTQTSIWETNDTLRAGINSFGLSGTNCHLILEEAPSKKNEKTHDAEEKAIVLPLSAKSLSALKQLAINYSQYLENEQVDLTDTVFTAANGRLHYEVRLGVVFNSRKELCKKLRAFVRMDENSLPIEGIYFGRHRIVASEGNKKYEYDLTEAEAQNLEINAKIVLREKGDKHMEEVLNEWAKSYVKGADLNWRVLTNNQEQHRISLPTYPFEHVHCWGKVGKKREYQSKLTTHHLLGKEIANVVGHKIYAGDFSTKSHWELDEHKINNHAVLPGTTYVEMLVAAGLKEQGDFPLTFTNIMFGAPFTTVGDEIRKLHTLIEDEDGKRRFRFVSSTVTDEWIQHGEGVFINNVNEYMKAPKKVDLAKVKNSLNQIMPVERNDDIKRGLYLGKRWDECYKNGWMNSEHTHFLIELAVPEEFQEDAKKYYIYPSLMDVGINGANNFMSESELYLPLSYGKLTVYNKLPKRVFFEITKIKGEKGGKTQVFNVNLYAPDGEIVVEVTNYCIKSTSDSNLFKVDKQSDLYGYSEVYKLESEVTNYREVEGKTIAFIGKAPRLFNELIEVYKGRNEIIKVPFKTSDDLEELVNQKIDIGIFAWTPSVECDFTDEALIKGFEFMKKWLALRLKVNEGLVLLTQNGVFTMEDKIIHPGQAALSGFNRTMEKELSHMPLRCIDCDKEVSISLLANEIVNKDRAGYIVYRENRMFVPQIENNTLSQKVDKLETTVDGVMIITGGTGELGRTIAKALASNGINKIVLFGKQNVPDEAEWDYIKTDSQDEKISQRYEDFLELKDKLEVFKVLPVNMSNENEVLEACEKVRSQYGPIIGVMHLAGNVGDGFIINKSRDVFDNVYQPKASGAWYMHKATLQDHLRWFISFSSIATLDIQPGQADYVAANMFLDALARYRKSINLPVCSIEWPAWREVGMAKRMNAVDEEELFIPVNTDEAIKLLMNILVMDDKMPAVIMPGKMKVVAPETKEISHKVWQEDENEVVLVGVQEPDEIELNIARIWANTLDMNQFDIEDDFNSLGGNSLLISQLLSEYEKVYPGQMEVADLFTYSTIGEQAQYLRQKGNPVQEVQVKKVKNDERNQNDSSKDEAIQKEQDLDEILELVASGKMTIEESALKVFLK